MRHGMSFSSSLSLVACIVFLSSIGCHSADKTILPSKPLKPYVPPTQNKDAKTAPTASQSRTPNNRSPVVTNDSFQRNMPSNVPMPVGATGTSQVPVIPTTGVPVPIASNEVRLPGLQEPTPAGLTPPTPPGSSISPAIPSPTASANAPIMPQPFNNN